MGWSKFVHVNVPSTKYCVNHTKTLNALLIKYSTYKIGVKILAGPVINVLEGF